MQLCIFVHIPISAMCSFDVATRQQSERELCAKRECMLQITLLTYLIKKETKEDVG